MIAAILRLFALRPLFSIMILGFPLLLLVALGLFTIVVFKFVVFIVLPVALAVWLIRKRRRSGPGSTF